MMEAHNRLYVEQAEYARTIPIPTEGVKTTEFDIPQSQAQALFDSGAQAATEFLAGWHFSRYIEKFRIGTPLSRAHASSSPRPPRPPCPEPGHPSAGGHGRATRAAARCPVAGCLQG